MNVKPKHILLTLLFVLVLIPFLYQCFYLWNYSIDDAAITFRYARNLAKGNGLTFNPGFPGGPVEGYTNLLWTLLHTPFFVFDVDPVKHGKILGTLLSVLTLAFLYLLNVRITKSPVYSFIPVILLAGNPVFCMWTIAGLETPLFILLTLAAFYFFICGIKRHGFFFLSSILYFLAILTRPEAVIFFLVSILLGLMVVSDEKQLRKFLTLSASVCLAGLCIYHLWRLYYFGDIIPNSYSVKGCMNLLTMRVGCGNLIALYPLNFNGIFFWIGLISILALAETCLKQRYTRKTALRSTLAEPVNLTHVYSFIICFFYLCYLGLIAWDRVNGTERYLMHIMPFFYTLPLLGILLILRSFDKKGPRIVLGLAAAALVLVCAYSNYQNAATRFAGRRGMLAETERTLSSIADYLKLHGKPNDKVIAQDMGFTPFYAENFIFVDSLGLCDKTVGHFLRKYNYNYFVRYLMWRDPVLRDKIIEMDNEIRKYLTGLNAEWILFMAYLPAELQLSVEQINASIADKTYNGSFDKYLEENFFFHGLFNDPSLKMNYAIQRVWLWGRSAAYYILYKRI